MKKLYCSILMTAFCAAFINAQTGPPSRGFTIEPGDETAESNDSSVVTNIHVEGEKFDTAIFDSTWRVPFRIYENRGEEMIHNWVHLGAPRAPHIYLGGGFYHFDKGGLYDIQMGWFPIAYPRTWEFYVAAERMFFFRKKSKEVDVVIGVDVDYYNGKVIRYGYESKLRKDKFYGVVGGIAYEGLWNPAGKELNYQAGENSFYQLKKYYQVSVRAGLARMKCKNVEYEAPFRRKGRFRASSMSRLQIGLAYFPVQKYEALLIAGQYEEAAVLFVQEKLAGYISWEGRVALMHMKREWGLSANFTFMAPSWNRETDYPFALTCTWGLYFSLDRKNPKWER